MFGTTIPPETKEDKESSHSWKHYSPIIGFSILVFLLIILLTPLDQLRLMSTVIDSELSFASENQTPVLNKLDLSSSEQLRKFPAEIGDWKGSDYDTSAMETSLGADCMLMRAYSKPGLYQPIFFLIIQSEVQSSFHSPTNCYRALGWTIEEVGDTSIIVSTSWVEKPSEKVWPSIAKHPKYPEYIATYSQVSIPAKRLVVVKVDEESVIERRVVLYFYLKDSSATSNAVTMMRVSALAPLTGSYNGIMNIEEEFISDAFPYMFEIQEKQQGEMIIVRLAKSGVGGRLLLAFLFSIPIAILIYPRIRQPSATTEKKTRDEG